RGGSFRDRPQRCRSGFRLDYPWWHKVHDVGFRVVVPASLVGGAANMPSDRTLLRAELDARRAQVPWLSWDTESSTPRISDRCFSRSATVESWWATWKEADPGRQSTCSLTCP